MANLLTDLIRSAAFGAGRTPFGSDGMQSSRWALQLTSSHWSRGTYGGLKAVCFCALGLLLAWPYVQPASAMGGAARLAVDMLVYVTIAFAVVRAIPVLWEGRRYLGALRNPDAKTPLPRTDGV